LINDPRFSPAGVLAPKSKADLAFIMHSLSMVEQKDTREKVDIVALNAEIERIVAREQVLRDEIARIIAEIEVGA
jgi:type I restriction enzyme M protein